MNEILLPGDTEMIETYVPAAMIRYFAKKLPHLGSEERRSRIVECVRGLVLLQLNPGDILFSKEIDDVWHYWILETREYAALCDKLPTGRFLHHSSFDYPPTAEAEQTDGRSAVRRLIVYFTLYVGHFGPLQADRRKYWPTLEPLLAVRRWCLDDANTFFARKWAEL